MMPTAVTNMAHHRQAVAYSDRPGCFYQASKREQGEQQPIRRYTYIQYLIEKDQTLVFSFNAPARNRQEWQETARKIMTSIKVK